MPAELTYDTAYPGRFIKAGHLNGKHVTVTVDRVFMETLEGEKGKQAKLIMAFAGKELQWVVCKTNGYCIKEMLGNKVADWIGKRITIYPTKVPFGSKQVDAIRVFGSPDISAPVEISARMGKRPLKATMQRVLPGQHGFKGGEPHTAPPQPQEEPNAPQQTANDLEFQYENSDAEPGE